MNRPKTICVLLSLATLTPAAHAQWTMTNLHPATSTSSYALSTAAGKIGGYAYLPNPARQSAGMWPTPEVTAWVELAPLSPPQVPSTISTVQCVGGSLGNWQGGNWVHASGPGAGMNRACIWGNSAAGFSDLHPPTGYLRSAVTAITDGGQFGWVQDTSFINHACRWFWFVSSRVDMSPPGTASSAILAGDDTMQGGYFTFTGTPKRACVWYGSAANAFNFHPGGSYSSEINALFRTGNAAEAQLVGSFTVGPNVNDGRACLWTISPEGNVMVYSLHTEGIDAQSSVAYGVHGGVQVGNVTINNLTRASVWFGHANTREDPLPNLPVGTTQTEARGVFTTPTTITVVGMINRPGGNWNAVAWTKPNTPPPCSPADVGSAGGLPGSDGSLDNNDFIVFINRFFEQSATADVGSAGGLPGSDGLFDNNDFIVFINQFFDGAANC